MAVVVVLAVTAVVVALVAVGAAPTNDSITVTVSAGPVLVVEAPPPSENNSQLESSPLETHRGATSLPVGCPAGLLADLFADPPASPPADPPADPPASSPAGRGRGVLDLARFAGLLRKAAHRLARSLGNELRDLAEGTGPPAGRRKKNDAWPMLGAGLIMGGTLLTIGLGALAAMSGKALMSSMLALGMSLMNALRPARRCRRAAGGSARSGNDGGGCGGDNDNYEIIARPVITHGHTHSAVLHHDPMGPMGTMGSNMAVGAGYPGYVRSLVQAGPAEQIQAIQTSPSTSVDVADFARSGVHRPPSSSFVDSSSDESSPASWLGGLGGVIGMRGPQQQSLPAPQAPPASDNVLSLTLGTWGPGPGSGLGHSSRIPGQAKHRNGLAGSAASTQPRAQSPGGETA